MRLPSLISFALLLSASVYAANCPNGGLNNVHYNSTAAAIWAATPIQNTSRTGRTLRLLEPADGILIHGAGQDPFFYTFSTYTGYMANPNDGGPMVPPLLSMTYMGVKGLNQSTPGQTAPDFVTLANALGCYGSPNSGVMIIPQLGLSMTDDDGSGTVPPYDKEVAEGLYDFGISQLVNGLKTLNGWPVFMRIGYEMNGKWNNYTNTTFIAAWQRIHAAVKAEPILAKSVAFVWDYSCDEPDRPWSDFWMNDTYIDWYGVNIFSNHSAPGDTQCVRPFLDFARQQGFPVIFAETTPRYIGSSIAAGSWEEWYQPMFDLIADYDDVVKAWCYIDWNWNQPQWLWNDARIEIPGAVGPEYRSKWAALDTNIVHAMPMNAVLRALGVQ